MRHLILVFGIFLLSGCSFMTDRQLKGIELKQKAEETASGAMKNMNDMYKNLEGMVLEGKERIDTAKEGIDMIIEGKEKLGESLK